MLYGMPVELFGRTEFPSIGEKPYLLTLSPHATFWFSLEPRLARQYDLGAAPSARPLVIAGPWGEILQERERQKVETRLPAYLRDRRWFGAKGREVKSARIREIARLPFGSTLAIISIVSVDYIDGEPEEYLLPLSFEPGGKFAAKLQNKFPQAVICTLQFQDEGKGGILYDACYHPKFATALLQLIAQKQSLKGPTGDLRGETFEPGDRLLNSSSPLKPSLGKAEQSNTSVVFGDQLILKLFRRLDIGINPDLEIVRMLAKQGFSHIPALAGELEYLNQTGETVTLGIISSFVPNSKDAWVYTLESLNRFFERVHSMNPESTRAFGTAPLSVISAHEPPERVSTVLGAYLESARLLGQRTAEMHLALSSDPDNKDFAAEPFTPFYQRSLYQSMRNLVIKNLELLKKKINSLAEAEHGQAEKICAAQGEILKRLRTIYETRLTAMRIRCHGDYHLGQVLYTGKDFIIIDFEGEPARSIGERRIKRSPMRDVAGMIRSFHYVSYAALLQQLELGIIPPDNLLKLQPWSRFWYHWISATFFLAYQQVIAPSALLPASKDQLSVLLYAHLLEKAIYELGYELNNRPEWVKIPLEGVLQLLDLAKV